MGRQTDRVLEDRVLRCLQTFAFMFPPTSCTKADCGFPLGAVSHKDELLTCILCEGAPRCSGRGSWVTQVSTAALGHQPSFGDVPASGPLRFLLQQEGPC